MRRTGTADTFTRSAQGLKFGNADNILDTQTIVQVLEQKGPDLKQWLLNGRVNLPQGPEGQTVGQAGEYDLQHFLYGALSIAVQASRMPNAMGDPKKTEEKIVNRSLNAVMPPKNRTNLNGGDVADILAPTMEMLRSKMSPTGGNVKLSREFRQLMTDYIKNYGDNLTPETFVEFLQTKVLPNPQAETAHKDLTLVFHNIVESAKERQIHPKKMDTPQNPNYGQRYKEIADSGNANQQQLEGLRKLANGGGGMQMPGMSSEVSSVDKKKLAFYDLPWTKTSTEIDLKRVREVLDEDHYGMEAVKEEIIEEMAVQKRLQKMGGEQKGNVVILVGPPGTGKTSIAKSIARATGRNFTEVSVGGVDDVRTITGFESTYVGSKHGRILEGFIQAGSQNPVFLIDEVDKMGKNARGGDPAQALLHVVDPSTNKNFRDTFMPEVPVDLSNAFFVMTANYADQIPEALKDRAKIIEVKKYTSDEKTEIAKRHIIPKTLRKLGIFPELLNINDDGLKTIFGRYAVEPGMRTTERLIEKIGKKNIILEDEGRPKYDIGPDDLHEILAKDEPDFSKRATSTEEFNRLFYRLDWEGVFSDQQFEGIERLIGKVGRSGVDLGRVDDQGVKDRLNTILRDLPWKPTQVVEDLQQVRQVLDNDHTGLEEPKDTIMEHLALENQRKAAGLESEGNLMLMVGPAGTGKTSIAESIARATGRKYARIALAMKSRLICPIPRSS